MTLYDDLIVQVSATYRLPVGLVCGQVLQESGGQADAFRYEPSFYGRYIKGRPGAQGYPYGPIAACSFGLMQILFETALEHGFAGQPWELFDPTKNLNLGCAIMRNLWDWAGGLPEEYPRALAAYNGGTGTADSGPPWPNQAYVDGVYRFAGTVPPDVRA